jgi:hypothetical protein
MSDIFGGPPDDEGYDPLEYPIDYAEVEDPHGFFRGDLPEDWWYDNLTVEDEFGYEHTAPINEWFDATFADEEITQMQYGMDPWEIIYELEDMGYWTDEHWETWREFYENQ